MKLTEKGKKYLENRKSPELTELYKEMEEIVPKLPKTRKEIVDAVYGCKDE